MTRLDTNPKARGLRTEREPADAMLLLIRVPRVDEPAGTARARHLESPRRGRPVRRRLRRGVRRAGWSLLILAAMGGTFFLGWTTRGSGSPRLAALTMGRDADRLALGPAIEGREPTPESPAAEADAVATAPALGAPVADAEVPVDFPGYLLPDNAREEPAHEGS